LKQIEEHPAFLQDLGPKAEVSVAGRQISALGNREAGEIYQTESLGLPMQVPRCYAWRTRSLIIIGEGPTGA